VEPPHPLTIPPQSIPAASLQVDDHKQQAVCGSTADVTGNLLMGIVRSAFHCGLVTLLLLVLNLQSLVLNWIRSEVIFILLPFFNKSTTVHCRDLDCSTAKLD
jgi:hypothetical protein